PQAPGESPPRKGKADWSDAGRCSRGSVPGTRPIRAATRSVTRRRGPGAHCPLSIAVGADHLAVGPRAEGPVGLHVDRGLDELDAPVAKREVGPAGVVALGVDELRLVGRRSLAAQLAYAPGVVLGIGRDDGVEQRVVALAQAPDLTAELLDAVTVTGAGREGLPEGVAGGQCRLELRGGLLLHVQAGRRVAETLHVSAGGHPVA